MPALIRRVVRFFDLPNLTTTVADLPQSHPLRSDGAQPDLMLEILAVDLEQRRASESNNAAGAALEDSPGGAALDLHVQREFRNGQEDYVAHTREVVGVLNSRHAKDLEIVAVVLASVLGGAVGAALTAIAGFAAGSSV